MRTEKWKVNLSMAERKKLQDIASNGTQSAKIIRRANILLTLDESQVSEMTKGLNEQVQEFRSRSLAGRYPVIWTDALYEKVRVDGRVISMAVQVACGVNGRGSGKCWLWSRCWTSPKRVTPNCFKA